MQLSDRIIPTPQKLNVSEKTFALGSFGAVSYRIAQSKAHFSLEKATNRLKAELKERFGCEEKADASLVITLVGAEAPAGVKNPDQGYAIRAEEGKIVLSAFGEAGAYYAVTTLLQILKAEDGAFTLPAFDLLDYPDLQKRGHFVETRFGTDLMELEDWKQVVDAMVDVKENQLTVSVYGCWNMQYDKRISEYVFLPFKGYEDLKTPVYKKYYSPKKGDYVFDKVGTPMAEKDFFGELRAYGKERGVEVIPMFNSLGHNTLIPRLYPETSAKDENGNPANTGFCTAEPKTYEILFALYDQIIDRYSTPDNPIESFDIGMDEIRNEFAVDPADITHRHNAWCQCPICRNKSRQEIFFEHAAKLMKHLHSRGVKTVYMYNDMVVEHKTKLKPNPEDHSPLLKEALAKHGLLDVACVDWWAYNDVPEKLHFSDLHPELGFRSSIKPWNGYYHWSHVFHPIGNIYHMIKMAHASGAEAKRSYSSWDNSFHRPNQLQADWSWNWNGTGTMDDAKARYVRRHFPASIEAATKAFDLWDDITRQTNVQDPKNTLSNRREMIFSFLVYYRYSYYFDGRDYPRNYPGELVPKLRAEADFCAELREMQAQAEEAAKVFEEVAKANPDSAELAMRYRYEMMLYTAIFRDWTTLMDLDALAAKFSETKDEAIIAQMADLAKAQKNFRLEVIALLENTKEDYLIPSHARNQTIPMQYFADLEAYLKNTPAAELKLDLSDMRHMASETFMNLR